MSRRNQGPGNVTSSIIYLGQVPYDWDENNVKSVVCGSGKVVDVRLGFDYAGKNKGFCFVEYLNSGEAQRAAGLLNQIKIFNQPNKGQFKKLRVESSKEGFLKSNSPSESKPVLNLDRSSLPTYVQVPQEMLVAGGGPIPQNFPMVPNQVPTSNIFSPRLNQPPQQPPQSQVQIPQGSLGGPQPQIPAKILYASKHLPQPQSLPFDSSSDINQVLSKIPPVQLIELIATIKNFLNNGDENKVYEILNFRPDVSAAVAQALLMMGFIDNEVINSSKDAPARQTPQPPIIQPQQQFQLPQQQNFNPIQQPSYNNINPNNRQIDYTNLPPETQVKLTTMSDRHSIPIAQVLALPQDQIDKLGPQEKELVNYLRSQYRS